MPIRVVLFDDNSKRRDGIKLLLDSLENIDCVGVFPDCRKVVQNVKDSKPDVVLMDIDMPHVNGIDGVKLIRTEFPDLKILMQTVFEDNDKVFAAICAGANGYILKQSSPLKLIESISEVLEGGSPMTPVIATKVLELFNKLNQKPKKEQFDLTQREKEILKLLVEGYTYKVIAEKCFISYPTVNTHISHIYKKLHVESAAGAISKAIQSGILD